MKEIIVVIRPEKWRRTSQALEAVGVDSLTQRRVLGRGRQAGLRYLSPTGAPSAMHYLPKRLVSFLVATERVERAVEAIINSNKTGVIGDGKIFICPADVAVPGPGEPSA